MKVTIRDLLTFHVHIRLVALTGRPLQQQIHAYIAHDVDNIKGTKIFI
jgi:hypothetical protein